MHGELTAAPVAQLAFVCSLALTPTCMWQGKMNALHLAARGGSVEVCKLLIDAGMDLSATDEVSWPWGWSRVGVGERGVAL